MDAAGNVLLWRMSTNIGVSPAECWAVNLEDGSVKNILSATVEGLEGRFDYFGVYGDVVNGDGYLLSATSNGDELYGKTVLRWRYVGGVLQPQDESDQILLRPTIRPVLFPIVTEHVFVRLMKICFIWMLFLLLPLFIIWMVLLPIVLPVSQTRQPEMLSSR